MVCYNRRVRRCVAHTEQLARADYVVVLKAIKEMSKTRFFLYSSLVIFLALYVSAFVTAATEPGGSFYDIDKTNKKAFQDKKGYCVMRQRSDSYISFDEYNECQTLLFDIGVNPLK